MTGHLLTPCGLYLRTGLPKNRKEGSVTSSDAPPPRNSRHRPGLGPVFPVLLYCNRPRLSISDSVVVIRADGPPELSRVQESLLEQGEAWEAAVGGTTSP